MFGTLATALRQLRLVVMLRLLFTHARLQDRTRSRLLPRRPLALRSLTSSRPVPSLTPVVVLSPIVSRARRQVLLVLLSPSPAQPRAVLLLSRSPGTLEMALVTLTPVLLLPRLTLTLRRARLLFMGTRPILRPRLLKHLRRLSLSRRWRSPYHLLQP